MDRHYDAVIVGAGLAGLRAANVDGEVVADAGGTALPGLFAAGECACAACTASCPIPS